MNLWTVSVNELKYQRFVLRRGDSGSGLAPPWPLRRRRAHPNRTRVRPGPINTVQATKSGISFRPVIPGIRRSAVAAVALAFAALIAGCTSTAAGVQPTDGPALSGTSTPESTLGATGSSRPVGKVKARSAAVEIAAATLQDVQQLHADVAGLAQGGLPPDTFTTAAGEVAQHLRARADTLRRITTNNKTSQEQEHRTLEKIAAQLRAYADIAGDVAKLHGTDVPAALIHRLRKVDHSWTSAMSDLTRMTHTSLLQGLPPFHYPESVPSPPK